MPFGPTSLLTKNTFRPKSASHQIEDVIECGRKRSGNRSMLSHTPLDTLTYRNTYCKRIVTAFLDRRNGMSYGLMARQLSMPIRPVSAGPQTRRILTEMAPGQSPVLQVDEALMIRLDVDGEVFLREMPDV